MSQEVPPLDARASAWSAGRERRVVALLALVALAFLAPLLWKLQAVGGELDWRYFQMLWEVDRKSVMEFGQFPLWNPYYCGGNAQLGNPQSQFFSLATPVSLLLGAAVGIKAHIFIHYLLGFYGAWRLARAHQLQPLGALGAALVFGLSGFFAMRAGGGHSAFLPFFFLPWAAFFYDVGKRHLAGAVGLGLTLALQLMEGGMYPFSLTGGMLAFLAVFDLWTAAQSRRAVVRTAVGALLVMLVAAAVKLVVVLEFTSEFPRQVPVKDSLNLSRVLSMFIGRQMGRQCEGCVYVWPEYINYVGPVVLAVFLGSLGRLADLRWRRAYVVAACATLLLIGDHGPWAPYVLLHNMPPYDSLRVPGRWAIVVVLQMALLFGAFLDAAPRWLQQRARLQPSRALVLVGTLLGAVALDMALQNGKLWSPGFQEVPPAVNPEPFHQVRGNATTAFLDVRRNVGNVDCYENVQIPTSKALWVGKTEQVRVDGAGDARLVAFSPNAWTVEANLPGPGVVLLNQNHHRLWRVVDGPGTVVNRNGLLAVELPAGASRVTVRYAPTAFWLLLLLSLAGWGAGVTWLWRTRRAWFVLDPGEPQTVPPAVVLPAATETPVEAPVETTAAAVTTEPLVNPQPPEPAVPTPPPPSSPGPVAGIARWRDGALAALQAGVLVGAMLGVVEAADLLGRGVAPANARVSFVALTMLGEGGLAALVCALVLLLVRSLAWRGHAVGRAWSAPLRGVLGLDETQEPGAWLFAGLGGLLTGTLTLWGGVGALGFWAQKAFNARELAAALVGALAVAVLVVAVAVGALVRAGLLRLARGPLLVLSADRLAAALPWVGLLLVGLVAGVSAAQPILKETDLRPVFYPLGAVSSGLALSLVLQGRGWVRGRSTAVALAAALLCAVLGITLSPGAQAGAAVLERTYLTGRAVVSVRNAMDGDKDGYSRVLGGMDCNDARADVHPGAMDIPDNGVDEDCSGEDFHVPPRAPDVHAAPLPEGVAPFQNVLLIVVDTLRQDRLHLFGNSRPNTPYLDNLALSSAVFENAYANGVRSHRSIPSILTGRYPSRLKMAEGRTELMTLLPQNLTLAERLTPQGYGAACFILEKYFEGQEGLTQGFDFFNPRRVDPNYRDWSRPQGEGVANAAMRWIAEQGDRPWLAWTHFYDPHLYWHDTPFGVDELARYDAAVAYVDAQLGRLIDDVKSKPMGPRTLIIITADHGQGLGTHGEYGHGQNLWQEDIRVPMLIHAPGFPAQRIKTVVENVDLVPTILNLLGRTQGVDNLLDGKTLVPFLTRGDAAAGGQPGVAVVEGLTDQKQPKNRRAVVRGAEKLLLDLNVGSTQLFDVDKDRLETSNLAAQRPETVSALKALLDAHTALSAYIMSATP